MTTINTLLNFNNQRNNDIEHLHVIENVDTLKNVLRSPTEISLSLYWAINDSFDRFDLNDNLEAYLKHQLKLCSISNHWNNPD